MPATTWTPSHVIVVKPLGRAPYATPVMLLDGSAYSQVEWRASEPADWTRDADGSWYWRDAVAPCANGTVEVRCISALLGDTWTDRRPGAWAETEIHTVATGWIVTHTSRVQGARCGRRILVPWQALPEAVGMRLADDWSPAVGDLGSALATGLAEGLLADGAARLLRAGHIVR